MAFSQMNPQEGSMARAYNEFLSVIGKPLGMRGNTLTYADYVGSHSCNGPCGAGKGDHVPVIALTNIGGSAAHGWAREWVW
eukprot:COSAG01_NODE_1959_length_8800_cov_81.221584_3_plen_81_part_00